MPAVYDSEKRFEAGTPIPRTETSERVQRRLAPKTPQNNEKNLGLQAHADIPT